MVRAAKLGFPLSRGAEVALEGDLALAQALLLVQLLVGAALRLLGLTQPGGVGVELREALLQVRQLGLQAAAQGGDAPLELIPLFAQPRPVPQLAVQIVVLRAHPRQVGEPLLDLALLIHQISQAGHLFLGFGDIAAMLVDSGVGLA